MIHADVNVKELIDKEIFHKGFICDLRNCERECDKLCDIGKCLNYANYKCTKSVIYKLVEECIKNIGENEMIYNSTVNDHKNICKICERSSCTIYIILFSAFLTISIGIGTVFIYFYW